MLIVEIEKMDIVHKTLGSLPMILIKRDGIIVDKISSEAVIDALYFLPDDVKGCVEQLLMSKGLSKDECQQIYPDIISAVKTVKKYDRYPPENLDLDV